MLIRDSRVSVGAVHCSHWCQLSSWNKLSSLVCLYVYVLYLVNSTLLHFSRIPHLKIRLECKRSMLLLGKLISGGNGVSGGLE